MPRLNTVERPHSSVTRSRAFFCSPGQTAGIRNEIEVFVDGQISIERRVFGQIAQAFLDGEGLIQCVMLVDARGATRGEEGAGENLHDRGLPGPVGTEKTDYFTVGNREADVSERLRDP